MFRGGGFSGRRVLFNDDEKWSLTRVWLELTIGLLQHKVMQVLRSSKHGKKSKMAAKISTVFILRSLTILTILFANFVVIGVVGFFCVGEEPKKLV